MKTLTLASLKKLIREQGYKMAALRDQNGTRIVPFNKYKKNSPDLDYQIKIFETRVLKNDMYLDGLYIVQLAHNIQSARAPHEFGIVKGNLSASQIEEAEKKQIPLTPVIIEKEPSVLTWESALKMQQEISDLKNQVNLLELEKKNLLEQIAELEDQESEDLSEATEQKSPLAQTLNDALPTLTALADRYFNLEEKKLDLEALRLQKPKTTKQAPTPNGHAPKKMILVGSQEHLNLIEKLFNEEGQEAEEAFNLELDKLQAKNTELYKKVLNALGLSEEEEEQEEQEEGGANE